MDKIHRIEIYVNDVCCGPELRPCGSLAAHRGARRRSPASPASICSLVNYSNVNGNRNSSSNSDSIL